VRVAIVFPGQGTQTPGMGAPWQDHPAWKLLEQAEGALGEPLRSLVLDAPAEQLARTRDAQLAVLCTSLVAWEAVRPLTNDVVAFAGHSLGQVTALVASGALELEDGVRFAARRAELTQRAADDHPGRMAALLGATVEQAADACTAAPDACWIANDNAPGQVVIAGTPEGLDAAVAHAKEIGVRRATTLNVGGAFHTPLMASAAEGILAVLDDVPFASPSAPVVANADGIAYAQPDGWPQRSAEHVTVPVRWRTCMETLAGLGADAFVEVGAGSMIAGLAKRTVPDTPVLSCASPSDLETLAEVLAS
jgi:[acyl-carrier-protein] S-malonyltransferase